MAAALSFVVKAVDEATDVLKSIGDEAEGLGGKLAKVGDFAARGFKQLGNATLAGGAALAGFGTAAVTAFAGFEKGMNEVATLLPTFSDQQLGELSNKVLKLSSDLGVMPNEVVPALYQALSAGVPADNVIDFLQTSFKAATAGAADMTTAVDALTTVVNAYGPSTIDFAKASDIIFTTVRLGKTDFDQLSKTLFNVIPTAASLGIKFEEVGAAMAVMTARGVPTSVATTQLRALMVELSKESTNISKEFERISGKSFPEFIRSGGNLSQALNIMRGSIPDDEFRNLFSSVEAANAALLISGPNSEAMMSALEEMQKSTGATDAAFAKMDRGIARTWQRIKANASVAMISIGAAIAPLADKVLGALAEKLPVVINQIGKAIDGARDMVEPVAAALRDRLEPPLQALGDLIDQKVRPVFEQFGEFLRRHADDIRGPVGAAIGGVLVTALAAAAVAAGAFAASMVVAAAPVLAVVAAVAAISAGIYLLVTHWDDLKARFPILQELEDTFRRVAGQVGAIVAELGGLLMAIIDRVRDVVGQVRQHWGTITDIMRGPVQAVAAVVEGAFNNVRIIIETVLGVIRGVIQTVTALIKGDWQGAWDGIKQIGESTWNGIKDLVQNGIDTIKGIFEGFVTFFREIGPRIWGAAKSIWETVKTDGWQLMQEMGQKIIDVFTALPGKLLDLVPKLLDAGKALMGAIFDGLKSAASAVGGFAADIAETVGRAIKNFINEFVIDRLNRALEFTISNPLGPDIHINPPDIPRLATGGIITRAGLALVGERGPELVVLPAGAGVFPPERVTSAGAGPVPSRPPVPVVVSIELDGRQIARAILPDLRAEAERQGAPL